MVLLLSRSSHGEALAAAAAAHTERGTVRESIESLPVSRPRTPSFYEEERVSGSWAGIFVAYIEESSYNFW